MSLWSYDRRPIQSQQVTGLHGFVWMMRLILLFDMVYSFLQNVQTWHLMMCHHYTSERRAPSKETNRWSNAKWYSVRCFLCGLFLMWFHPVFLRVHFPDHWLWSAGSTPVVHLPLHPNGTDMRSCAISEFTRPTHSHMHQSSHVWHHLPIVPSQTRLVTRQISAHHLHGRGI
jgi:hypothetical protein